MLEELDSASDRVGVPRQSLIKILLAERRESYCDTSQVEMKGFFLYEAGAAGAWPPCTLEIPTAMRSARSCRTAAS